MNASLAHTILAVAILIAYTVLTALGVDGNALLALFGGQMLGAGVQKAATR
jgi:hypothetical protein